MKGMTDINPMWRIQKLTELFGPVGIGWYVEVTKQEVVEGPHGDKMAFMDILLYVRENGEGEWSKPIYGTGGSTLIAKETSGLRADDDAWKKTYTDALSVACKALGIGADIYWQGGANEAVGSHNNKPAAKPALPQDLPRPAVLNTTPKSVSQEDLTNAVKFVYSKITGTDKSKPFIEKIKEIIGSTNYMAVGDAVKRLELFNYVKEMSTNV